MEPNQYTLSGEHTELTYATTSIAGRPQLHFHDTHHDINLAGPEIETQDSPLGTLMTGTVAVSALNNVRLTLVLPRVQLRPNEAEATFESFAVLTTTQTEALIAVRQTYHLVRLHGIGRVVEF